MNLENMMLSEISQTQKNKYSMSHSYVESTKVSLIKSEYDDGYYVK